VVVARELVTRLFPLDGQSPKLTPQAMRNRPNRSLTTDYARLSGLRLKTPQAPGASSDPSREGGHQIPVADFAGPIRAR
jgi:hypothetical protein